MRASYATPTASRVSAACRMVAQSDWLPMMMATGFTVMTLSGLAAAAHDRANSEAAEPRQAEPARCRPCLACARATAAQVYAGSRWRMRSMSAQGSALRPRSRSGTVRMVKAAGSSAGPTSSHVTGVATGALTRERVEYGATAVEVG